MKVLKLKTERRLNVTEKLIKAILKRDLDAFKATSLQFIRNNQAYYSDYPNLIA